MSVFNYAWTYRCDSCGVQATVTPIDLEKHNWNEKHIPEGWSSNDLLIRNVNSHRTAEICANCCALPFRTIFENIQNNFAAQELTGDRR